jgi:nitrile hydratase accessory protein
MRASTGSTYTLFASPPASFGANRLLHAIQFISTYGTGTLSAPEPNMHSDKIDALPRIPRDDEGPVFVEPWQAQAFAIAIKLSEQGYFSWKEWAAALAAELKRAEDRGEPDDGTHYYEHWLAALERLVTSKGLTDETALADRKEAWADAYRHTPHGQPVVLRHDEATKG